MPEISKPQYTRYVIAHDGAGVAHPVEVTSSLVCTTGQPTLEAWDTPAQQAARVQELSLSQDDLDAILEGYPAWEDDPLGTSYPVGEARRHEGTLYEAFQAHDKQLDREPGVAVALWEAVVPDGVIPMWDPPAGTVGTFDTDERCTHPYAGQVRVWVSLTDGNGFEPGVANWREDAEHPIWIQPSGASDAWDVGETATHDGSIWESDTSGNTWEPPTQWTAIGPA